MNLALDLKTFLFFTKNREKIKNFKLQLAVMDLYIDLKRMIDYSKKNPK